MSESTRFVSVTLRVTGVTAMPRRRDVGLLPELRSPLELHQPEAEEPRRFVGTCDQCGRWYLVDWVPLTGEGHMLLLPSYEEFQAIFQADAG